MPSKAASGTRQALLSSLHLHAVCSKAVSLLAGQPSSVKSEGSLPRRMKANARGGLHRAKAELASIKLADQSTELLHSLVRLRSLQTK